jgi:DNA-binding beta-propeller fold protein YncE
MSESTGVLTFSDFMFARKLRKRVLATALVVMAAATYCGAADRSRPKATPEVEVPPLNLAGGRKLTFERIFSSDRDVRLKRSVWTRIFDTIVGAPDAHPLIRPYSIAEDSRGRLIVTDPGSVGVHIFDFPRQKYTYISHPGRQHFQAPQCVAVDEHDNIYVTDSEAGKIFVFDASGKFRSAIGSLKGGEGFFKHPTGIAVDSAAQRIYVSDTYRHKIFVLDLQGNVVQTFGTRGSDRGEFNFPTELRLHGQELAVVDALNFRVQLLDRSGQPLLSIGRIGEVSGTMFRPKGVDEDAEGNLYVVDALFDTVQVFDREGRLLYYFGRTGTGPQEFQLPAGLLIGRENRIYVVDSFNRRVQVFRYTGAAKQDRGQR